jgi:trans-aconitate 2-methyltransferase
MADWNAERYHEVSSPQQAWGLRLLERLPLAGTEHVLDIGCGTGRITQEIHRRVPAGRVVGLDRSPAMIEQAHVWLGQHAPGVGLVLGDATALPFRAAFEAVFSGATFHWIPDHDALFRSIIVALRPGGRLVAQCGGAGNLAALHARAQRLMRDPRFAMYFRDWTEPWNFADAASTMRRLAGAGFVDLEVFLQPAPTSFESPELYQDFIATVCVRQHLSRLGSDDRRTFLRELTVAAAADSPPFTLDYWRLNMSARRPA